MFRKYLTVVACLVAFGWTATRPTSASDSPLYQTRITFSSAIALPGMDLGAGTYVFERPLEGVADLVRVRSVDGRRIFLTALTDRVARPAGLKSGELISFGEALRGAPRPVTAWWPPHADHGYVFRYGGR